MSSQIKTCFHLKNLHETIIKFCISINLTIENVKFQTTPITSVLTFCKINKFDCPFFNIYIRELTIDDNYLKRDCLNTKIEPIEKRR